MSLSTLETQAQFARRLNKDRGHITRLKQRGHLVMRDGKVVVEDSLARLEALESPLARDQANRDRLAAERAAAAAEGEPDSDDAQSLEAIGRKIKIAQAKRMEAEAAMADIERQRLEGSLAETRAVVAAATDMAVALRSALERLPDRYAPELAAAIEPHQAHALLSEAVELVLAELAHAVAELPGALKAD